MTPIQKSLILAAAMLLLALASVLGWVPEEVAQFSPLGLLVFLPWAMGTKKPACGAAR